MQKKWCGGDTMQIKYPRKMHGGVLWAKIEILENVLSPLFKTK